MSYTDQPDQLESFDQLQPGSSTDTDSADSVNVNLTDDDEVIDGEVTLPGNWVEVVMAGDPDTVHTVKLTNRERVLWERASRQNRWGAAGDSPFEALTYMAWQAFRRDGITAGAMPYEQFIGAAESVEGKVGERRRPTR